jgi:hypothetical protein
VEKAIFLKKIGRNIDAFPAYSAFSASEPVEIMTLRTSWMSG